MPQGGLPKLGLDPVTMCHLLFLLLSRHRTFFLSMWTPPYASAACRTHQRVPHVWFLNQGVCVPCPTCLFPAISKC